jgi:hypothetical protein
MRTLLPLLLLAVVVKGGNADSPGAVPGSGALLRASDFVGFATAKPEASNVSGTWKQSVTLSRLDPIKGALKEPFTLNGHDPLVFAENTGVVSRFTQKGDPIAGSGLWPGLPTRFAEKGEYLVFLSRDKDESAATRGRYVTRFSHQTRKTIYTTVAAFRVESRTDSTGRTVRRVLGNADNGQALRTDTVRVLLLRLSQILARGERVPPDAAEPLDRLFQRPTDVPQTPRPVPLPAERPGSKS